MQASYEMALYNPNEPREPRVQVNVRMPQSIREGLDDVTRLWKSYAAARGDKDELDAIDLSYVIRRLLRAGIDQAFAEVGGRPTDEKAWGAVEAAILKATKKSSK